MAIKFITTPAFETAAKVLKKRHASFKTDLKNILKEIEEDPELGVSLGKGVKKIRMKIESKGKGKSGGARLITYEAFTIETDKEIVLLYIYDKSDMGNISDDFIKWLLKQYK